MAVALAGFFPARAAASIEDCLAATCRVSNRHGTGSGCAFEIREGEVRILTNYHVAEGGQVNVEFFDRGHKSEKILAASRWFSFYDEAERDVNVIGVPIEAFAGRPPRLIPLADRSTPLEIDQPIVSAGCEEARWPSAWIGHVVANEGRTVKFVPKAIPGRSGSAVFDEAGTQIVALIAWHDGTYGVAMTIGDVLDAMDGRAPAVHYAANLIPDRPLVAVGRPGEVATSSDALSGRACVHGVSLSAPCQFCSPWGCPPRQSPRREQPGGNAPQQGNGGVYPTRPPDEKKTAEASIDHSQFATKDELQKALDSIDLAPLGKRLQELEGGSMGLAVEIGELRKSHGGLNSQLAAFTDQVKADLGKLDERHNGLATTVGKLDGNLAGGLQGGLAAIEGKLAERVKAVESAVPATAKSAALEAAAGLLSEKLGVAISGGSLGLVGTLLGSSPPAAALFAGLWLLSRAVKRRLPSASEVAPSPPFRG